LSVRNENRRQVFVESEYDQGCYQELFRLHQPRLASSFSLEFIASGKAGQGNDVAVMHLVKSLRAAGNTVQGVVDRDDRQGAPEGVTYILSRRTLENVILDPLPVGILLLRDGFMASAEVTGENLRHFQVQARHVQSICDHIVDKIRRPDEDAEKVTVEYVGGFTAQIPRFWLEVNGHVLEERLKVGFPQLKKYQTNLKDQVVRSALADMPDFTPRDVLDLFQRLVS
jgi:hypothetical protein